MQLGEKLPLVLPAVPAGWHCSWKTLPRHTGISQFEDWGSALLGCTSRALTQSCSMGQRLSADIENWTSGRAAHQLGWRVPSLPAEGAAMAAAPC
jgi:hypothetical protein